MNKYCAVILSLSMIIFLGCATIPQSSTHVMDDVNGNLIIKCESLCFSEGRSGREVYIHNLDSVDYRIKIRKYCFTHNSQDYDDRVYDLDGGNRRFLGCDNVSVQSFSEYSWEIIDFEVLE